MIEADADRTPATKACSKAPQQRASGGGAWLEMEDPIFNHFVMASFYAAARAGKRILLEEPVFSETW